jgi:hypothetical protein
LVTKIVDIANFTHLKGLITNLSSTLGIKEHSVLKKLLNITIRQENILGEGRFSKVYLIPGTENFALRIPHNINPVTGELSKIKDHFEFFNFGQPIAKIGEKIEILKRQNGIRSGIPYELKQKIMASIDEGKVCKDDLQQGLDIYVDHLKRVAGKPQDTYNHFANTLKYLGSMDLTYDIRNANNLLIDYDEFKIVDELLKIGEYGSFGGDGSCKDMLVPLTDFSSGIFYCWDRDRVCKNNNITVPKEEIKQYINKIIENSIEASKEAGLPVFQSTNYLNNIFSLAGLDEMRLIGLKYQLSNALKKN